MLVDITGKPSRAAREGMLFKGRWGPGRERHRQRRDRLTYVLFKGEKKKFYVQKNMAFTLVEKSYASSRSL